MRKQTAKHVCIQCKASALKHMTDLPLSDFHLFDVWAMPKNATHAALF